MKGAAASSVADYVTWVYDIVSYRLQASELTWIEIVSWQTLWYRQITYRGPKNQYRIVIKLAIYTPSRNSEALS